MTEQNNHRAGQRGQAIVGPKVMTRQPCASVTMHGSGSVSTMVIGTGSLTMGRQPAGPGAPDCKQLDEKNGGAGRIA